MREGFAPSVRVRIEAARLRPAFEFGIVASIPVALYVLSTGQAVPIALLLFLAFLAALSVVRRRRERALEAFIHRVLAPIEISAPDRERGPFRLTPAAPKKSP